MLGKKSKKKKEEGAKPASVRAVVRVRPSNERESRVGDTSGLKFDVASATVSIASQNAQAGRNGSNCQGEQKESFAFDAVHGPESQQHEVFQSVSEVIDAVCAGFNGTILAYGESGSGKTHTMVGSPREPGVIQLSFEHLFKAISEQSQHGVLTTTKVSFFEIYNEKVYDLQVNGVSKEEKRLGVREPKKGVFCVQGLVEKEVTNAHGAMEVVQHGMKKRRVSFTNLNGASSRSHAVLMLNLESKLHLSKFTLVDLAGSECQKRAGTDGKSLEEGNNINGSLSVLCQVISSLINRKKGNFAPPFRNSILTKLLQNSLGGNSETCIIATLSPSPASISETKRTLDFAKKAMKVKNRAVLNEKTSAPAKRKQPLSDVAAPALSNKKSKSSRKAYKDEKKAIKENLHPNKQKRILPRVTLPTQKLPGKVPLLLYPCQSKKGNIHKADRDDEKEVGAAMRKELAKSAGSVQETQPEASTSALCHGGRDSVDSLESLLVSDHEIDETKSLTGGSGAGCDEEGEAKDGELKTKATSTCSANNEAKREASFDALLEERNLLREDRDSLRKELVKSEQRKKEMEAENKAQVAQKDGDIAALGEQVARKDEENRQVSQQLHEVKASMSVKDKEIAELRAQKDEIATPEEELINDNPEDKSPVFAHDGYTEDDADLEPEGGEAGLEAQLAQTEGQVAELKGQVAQKDEEIRKLEEGKQKVSQELAETRAKLEVAMTSLREKDAETTAIQSKLDQKELMVENLKGQIDSLTKHNQTVSQELDEAKASLGDKDEEIEELRAQKGEIGMPEDELVQNVAPGGNIGNDHELDENRANADKGVRARARQILRQCEEARGPVVNPPVGEVDADRCPPLRGPPHNPHARAVRHRRAEDEEPLFAHNNNDSSFGDAGDDDGLEPRGGEPAHIAAAEHPAVEGEVSGLSKCWQAKFGQLQKYKDKKGHCNVPRKDRLGSWVSNQRRNYKGKKLCKQQIESLEGIGFVWVGPEERDPTGKAAREADWKKQFQKLQKFKEMSNHCNVKQSEGRLGVWVMNQRQYYRREKLSKDKVQLLEELGFTWSLKNDGESISK